MTGKDTVYCQSDGTWTPSELPTCIPVQCPIPNGITNGKALYTAVAYKSVVNYECSYGFMVIGDRTRTCGEDKQWSGETPRCVVRYYKLDLSYSHFSHLNGFIQIYDNYIFYFVIINSCVFFVCL